MWETLKIDKELYPFKIASHALYQYRPDGYKIFLFQIDEQFKKKWNHDNNKWDLLDTYEYVVSCPFDHVSITRFDTIEKANNFIENEIEQLAKYLNETIFQIKRKPLKSINQ